MQHREITPRGFRTCARNVGIKDTTLDVTVITSDVPASAAALFTQNRFCGAAIIVGREQVANGQLQAFVINSKNANVATGEQGLADCREITRLVATELDIAPEDVLPSSTGVIERPLPMERIRLGMRGIAHDMQPGHLDQAAQAIMTTDTHPKIRRCQIGDAVLVGMAKGSNRTWPPCSATLSPMPGSRLTSSISV